MFYSTRRSPSIPRSPTRPPLCFNAVDIEPGNYDRPPRLDHHPCPRSYLRRKRWPPNTIYRPSKTSLPIDDVLAQCGGTWKAPPTCVKGHSLFSQSLFSHHLRRRIHNVCTFRTLPYFIRLFALRGFCVGILVLSTFVFLKNQRSQNWVLVWLCYNLVVHDTGALEACEQLPKRSSCERHTVIPVDHLLNIGVGPLIRYRFATRLESSKLPVSLLSCRTFSKM